MNSTNAGGRAHALVAGDGPPVVMLNGGGAPAAMFAPLMARLSDRTMFAIDHPGHGLSSHDPGYADDLRANAVQYLDGVMDGLDVDSAPIIASSFGSLCASWLALDRPARVTALVHLGCPAVVLDTGAPLPMRVISVRWLAALMARVPPSARQVRQVAKTVGEHPLEPEIAQLLLATQRGEDFPASFAAIVQTLVRLRGQRPELALTAEQLGGISQPTLLVFGERDPFGGPEVGERVATALPHAELRIVDAGHAPWLRHAEAIGRWITEFLPDREGS